MIFDTKVAGIPCQCQVTYHTPYIPANLNGHPDNWTPPEGGDFEFQLLDRRGYKASWLEKKLTQADNDRLYQEFQLAVREEDYLDPCF